MNKITINVGRLVSRLCSLLLVMLGFSMASCKDENGVDDGLCMYGTPVGDFEIKGKVTDESNAAVAGAKIVVKNEGADSISSTHPEGNYFFRYKDTYTDTGGAYTVDAKDIYPLSKVKVVCYPEDDTLEADSVIVPLKYPGDGGVWSYGTATATVDFTLKKKP